jgi:hypothetical protein
MFEYSRLTTQVKIDRTVQSIQFVMAACADMQNGMAADRPRPSE